MEKGRNRNPVIPRFWTHSVVHIQELYYGNSLPVSGDGIVHIVLMCAGTLCWDNDFPFSIPKYLLWGYPSFDLLAARTLLFSIVSWNGRIMWVIIFFSTFFLIPGISRKSEKRRVPILCR